MRYQTRRQTRPIRQIQIIMRLLVLILFIVLTSCTIRDCKLDPTLEISQNSDKNTENKDKNISMGTVQDLARDATKGGQVTCRF